MPRKQKKYHYLYKTTNLINNKFYVGMHSTDNLEDGYLGSGKHLRNSINKHGKENFKREILEFFEDRKKLIEKEKFFVNEDFIKDPMCMNLKKGGDSFIILSEESRLKMAELKIGNKNMLGKKHTDESIKKMRDAQLGKTQSKETVQKRIKKLTGKKKGPYSIQARKNMSDGAKRKKLSQNHKKNISDTLKNRNVIFKPILQFSKNGKLIKEWVLPLDIKINLDFYMGNIYSCCNGKRKTANGYIWKWK